MAFGAIIGAGISAAASFLSNKRSGDKSEASVIQQQEFQERMSSTSYQRGMEDMRKAGLNPILAYKMGGASSPMGSMSVHPAGDIGSSAAAGANAVTSARGGKTTRALQKEQTTAVGVGMENTRAATLTQLATAGRITEETQHVAEQRRNTRAQAVITEAHAKEAAMRAGFLSTARGKGNFEADQWIKLLTGGFGAMAGGLMGGAIGRGLGRRRGRGRPGRPRYRSTGDINSGNYLRYNLNN